MPDQPPFPGIYRRSGVSKRGLPWPWRILLAVLAIGMAVLAGALIRGHNGATLATGTTTTTAPTTSPTSTAAGCAALGPWTAELAALPAQTEPAMFPPLSAKGSPWYTITAMESAPARQIATETRVFVESFSAAESDGDPIPLLQATTALVTDCTHLGEPTGNLTLQGGAWVNVTQ